mgnify:CR=1 FL=1
MNLGAIKQQVKRIFGDESQVQLTDDDILMWANSAQTVFVMNNEGVMEVTGFASSVLNQMEYNLPADLLVLDTVSYKSTGELSFFPLRGKSLREFDEYLAGWDGTTYGSGKPQYFHKYGTKLRLFPPPDAAGTSNIKIYYRKRPVALAVDGDTSELPEEYHNAIIDYILQRAYFMDEDYEAAQLAANSVDNDLKMNKERENWKHQDFYPMITIMNDDMESY